MKICQRCGYQNSDESKFCKKCGNKLGEPVQGGISPDMPGQRCPQCGAPRMPGQKFCVSCGYPFSAGDAGEQGVQEERYEKPQKKRRWIIPVVICLAVVIVGVDIFLYREEIASFFGGMTGTSEKEGESGADGKDDTGTQEAPSDDQAADSSDTSAGGSADDSGISSDGSSADAQETAAEEPKERSFTYAVYLGDFTWEEAKLQCEALGGQLATIYSEEEMSAIAQAIADSGIGPSTATGQYRYFWIGGTRRNNTEGDYYYWIDDQNDPPANLNSGEAGIYAAWGTDSPSFMWNNNGTIYNEDCMVLGYDEGRGEWIWNDVANDPYALNDWVGASRMGYICQFPN